MDINSEEIRTAPHPKCDLCGNLGVLLYPNLRDRLFAAPGNWNLFICSNHNCELIWPNPMPIAQDLGKAYVNYYTHVSAHSGPPTALKKLYFLTKRRWLTFAYGYPEDPSDKGKSLRRLSCYLLPTLRRRAFSDVSFFRFVSEGKLLDIGCGSGDWLSYMAKLGWNVSGVDFDPKAVSAARQQGLNVHLGSVEAQNFAANSFDAILLNQVIEHVPDPITTLKECARILKRGGKLLLYTPNSSSIWRRLFKKNWRGLEPPRHLHIFSINSIQGLFEKAGFKKIFIRPNIGVSVTYESYLLWRSTPNQIERPPLRIHGRIFLRMFSYIQNLAVGVFPSLGECLAVEATKE